MSSGTNGCSMKSALTYGGKSMIGSIIDEFSQDVALGEDEAVSAVAEMMGVAKEDRATFAKVTHENFATIFSNEKVTAEEVLSSLEEVMKADATLSKYVS